MRPRRILAALAVASIPLLAIALAPAHDRRALLVGVSHYDNLAPALQLAGPRNDVTLMRELLQRHGFTPQDVMVLADGVDGTRALPTRSNILAALDELVAASHAGDFVIFYYSGHGSQVWAPQKRMLEEPDGFDELILPADVGRWNGARRMVDKAIVDDEIGTRITALLGHGARVWAIFDTCHADTMTRGGDPDERVRSVNAAVLGAPPTPAAAGSLPPQPGQWAGPSDALPDRARLVAFYATGSAQTASERLIRSTGLQARWYGLFTYLLATTLEREPELTYRALARRIDTRMQSEFSRPATADFEISSGALAAEPALPPVAAGTR